VAALPDRESDLPLARGERGSARERAAAGASRLTDQISSPVAIVADRIDSWLLAGLAALVASAIALAIAVEAGVVGIAAVSDVVRGAVAGLALLAISGYAPARALARGELRPYVALLVLPLGAILSALSLGLLGLLHVPFKVSLVLLIAASGIATIRAGLPRPAPPGHAGVVRIGLPLLLAGLVGLISLVPIFRSGIATVPGQYGDGVMFVGSAVLLQHAPPTATRTDLPLNRIPIEWRSKYPIYYPYAATSTLSGLDPIKTFATVSALLLALTSLGFFLFARLALGAPLWVALLAMFLAPLERMIVFVTIHPFYNEVWGQFTLPFILLTGRRFLIDPDRRSAVLFLGCAALGLLAYPLMLPFPALFLAPYAWRAVRGRTGEIKEAAGRLRGVRWWVLVPAAVVAVPVTAVLVRGVVEKLLSAFAVLPPWVDLSGWHSAFLRYFPPSHFLGIPASGAIGLVGVAAVCVLAVLGVSRISADARRPMLWMIVVTALAGVYFRIRTFGELFYFRDLAFLGPYVLMLALVELGWLAARPRRLPAAAGIAGVTAALAIVPVSAATEIDDTFVQAGPPVLELRKWDQALPRHATIRIDVPASTYQLWCTYMLHDHPLSAVNPITGPFPHPPLGRKADYVIAQRRDLRPADALGQPVLENAQFELWRMNPAVPGPDVSSRRQVNDIKKITIPIG
jgi:hypothetical protein